MAYLALARKWRPKAFSEVVGQSHVVQALSNALDSGRVHHAFLFTGTRGVGKTTLARIFAKSLNCEQGMSAEPCQQCSTCRSIDEGRYIDLIEVDAASRTKVDDTRELLENVQYAPSSGKFKVYLIDEIHMLSGHSFNALLKTLEEPPEHVKFLFATTDPQKIPVTVLSRCLQFNLRVMRPEQIENQLVKILGNEGLEFEQAALHAIAKAADGSMRDGLSLLDQAIAQGGGEVKTSVVENMLGTINAQHSEAILRALGEQDLEKIMRVIVAMADDAVDFAAALDELLVQLYYISMAQLAPAAFTASDANQTLINSLASELDPEGVQLFYQIGLISKRDIALAPSLRIGFEMALLRMLCFDPVETGKEGQSGDAGSGPRDPATPTEALNVATSQRARSTKLADPAVPAESPSIAADAPVSRADASTQDTAEPSPIAVTLAGNNEWGELIEQTALDGLSKQLAMNCACEKIDPHQIDLSLSPKVQHLFKPERVDEIQQHLRVTLNRQVNVNLEVEESEKETPAECLERLGYEQHAQTRQNLQNDPGVKALMSEFGATINDQSIKTV